MAQNPPPPPPQHAGAQPAAGQQNQLALWAMITGIAAIVLIWIPYVSIAGLLAAIAAVVLGIMGNNKAKVLGGAGRGQAITGIVLGAVALALFIIAIVLVGAFLAGAS